MLSKSKTQILALTSALLICLSLFAAKAYALDYTTIFTVANQGDTTEQDVFYTNGSKPWLYLVFDNNLSATSSIYSEATSNIWKWENATVFPFIVENASKQNSAWVSISDTDWANNKDKVGTWTIDSNSDVRLTNGGTLEHFVNQATFQVRVVPEPVASLLFITGGLALLTLRRKKIQA